MFLSSATTLPPPPSPGVQDSKLTYLCGSDTLLHERYRILRTLGRGGFGVTFLARDVTLPAAPLCVVKQLCPKVNNPAALNRAKQRFWQEAKTLSQLGSHAQVPMLLDYFTIDNEFYLVQEYIRGTTLTREVRRSGPLSEVAVKRFLHDVLPVLRYIHAQGVIHRDIKPPNILRCRDDDRLVLIDFGAVKDRLAADSGPTHLLASTQFIGTVGFAPPEQVALRPTYASDIYALGVTCLFLLTGKTPLEFEYSPQTGEIDWQSHVTLGEYFSKILDRMLKTALTERYPSVDEVMRALDLEPHVDHLSQCMSNSPFVQPSGHHQAIEIAAPPQYRSPSQRAAEQIRTWRSRLPDRAAPSTHLAFPTMPL